MPNDPYRIVPASSVPPEHRPPILNERHSDWPFLFQWVPRSWNAWLGPPPRKIEGNAVEYPYCYKWTGYFWMPCDATDPDSQAFYHPKPIPDRGEWWRGTPDFYASMSLDGWYYRRGKRWDNVDGYYNDSFKIGKYD